VAGKRQVVFGEVMASDRLPDWASGGTVLIEWLQRQDLWKEAATRLKIQREGGYAGIDAFLFFLYYFGSGLQIGVKKFSERARVHHGQLAAVGDRKRLATQASMSRILGAVEAEHVQEFGSWLLRTAPDIGPVLSHPSVLTRDAVGEGWHLFDWDPTVTTLRHRALPVLEGTPDGRRRSELLGEPGYPGRKRGDVQFSRATLQHAGSGLWLGIEMAPGNGKLREAFQNAIHQVLATCEVAEIACARAILRADGVAGNVPFITACVEAGVHYITRLSHYQLLQDEDIVQHLNEAAWFEVPSSSSGPSRQATDLGRVILEPGPSSVRPDGSPFEPIEARVVVSRFPSSNDGRGAGVVLDGWQYELYGTDLLPAAWPEAEIVTGYYGRSGQENRFCQEDRELALDRIFSYHLPGQQLATLVGLFVWNYYICRGMELAHPPEEQPEQPLRDSPPLSEVPHLPEVDEPSDPSSGQVNAEPNAEVEPTSAQPVELETSSSAPSRSAESTGSDSTTRASLELFNALDQLDWEQMLHKHDSWQWLPGDGSLRCKAKALLPLLRIGDTKSGGIRVRFRAEWGTCDGCKLRHDCNQSADPHYRRDVQLSLPSPFAKQLREMWLSIAPKPRRGRPRRSLAKSSIKSSVKSRPVWRKKPLSWRPPDPPTIEPRLTITPPTLLPAELRRITRVITRPIEIHVHLDLPEDRPRPSLVLAYSAAERQKRRLSWKDRLRWNQLPPDAKVEIRMLGAGPLEGLLTHNATVREVHAKSA